MLFFKCSISVQLLFKRGLIPVDDICISIMCGGHKKKDNACKTFANGCVNKKYLLILNKVSSMST